MLECIEQEGFEFKHPASDIAEISVPPRFTSRPGSYICLLEGFNTQTSKPCQFVENQHKNQAESIQDNVNKRHPDQKGRIAYLKNTGASACLFTDLPQI